MFSDVSDDVEIDPGQDVVVHVTSSAPPGLVKCLASADTVVTGADEDTPSELESLIVGFSEYPHGYTVGPVENLKSLSETERCNYLLTILPEKHKLRWITDDAAVR